MDDQDTARVALLAEGVDRNRYLLKINKAVVVALLAEGVDRNNVDVTYYINRSESPSSRRAWIEMTAAESSDHDYPRRPPRGGRG